MKINLKISSRLLILITLQLLFVAILLVSYFLTVSNLEKTDKKRERITEEMNNVMVFTLKIKDYQNGLTDFTGLESAYKNLAGQTSIHTGDRLNEIWGDLKKIEDIARQNIEFEKNIVDLTNQSINQSNEFINSVSQALADPARQSSVTILERQVIAGANQNNNLNYQLQVMYKNLKENIDTRHDILNYLDRAIENVEKDVTRLARTKFAQLPVNARNATIKIKEIINQYIHNHNEHLVLNDKITSGANQIYRELAKEEINEAKRVTSTLRLSLRSLITVLIVLSLMMVFMNFGLSVTIRAFISAITGNMNQLKQGDLRMEKNLALELRKDELGTVYKAVFEMVETLRALVIDIITASNSFASASQELSSASQQLSQSASEQASSLEEISSSMEEMAGNIQQNSQNSLQTEKIAQMSSEGISDVSSAAMQSLDSVRNIAGKIQVINDIAFQTNILALNAAVEAARAGEHGKGFAVVAAEVRKLAERSKQAADEIINLASQSKDVTESAGNLMAKLIPEIQKTSQLVQEIAAASAEQNAGADQINNAIQQLNQITQQNAASAEEMATSSEEMSAQADLLKSLVGYFKIDNEKAQSAGKQPPKKKQPGNSNKIHTPAVSYIKPQQDDAFEEF
ncbi:MAG: methyl-accepting chemotaxis protein [Bacteroidales bacterium]